MQQPPLTSNRLTKKSGDIWHWKSKSWLGTGANMWWV